MDSAAAFAAASAVLGCWVLVEAGDGRAAASTSLAMLSIAVDRVLLSAPSNEPLQQHTKHQQQVNKSWTRESAVRRVQQATRLTATLGHRCAITADSSGKSLGHDAMPQTRFCTRKSVAHPRAQH